MVRLCVTHLEKQLIKFSVTNKNSKLRNPSFKYSQKPSSSVKNSTFKPNEANTMIEHNSQLLHFANKQNPLRITNIICTIGPSSNKVPVLEKMLAAGMKIARLNFSHGKHKNHIKSINNVRQAIKNYSEKIGFEYVAAIALDTRGPEIRTGLVNGKQNETAVLKNGAKIIITSKDEFAKKCSDKHIYVDYKNISKVVKPKNKIFMDDGVLGFVVDKVDGEDIHCTIENGGILGSHKGVSLPGIPIDLPAVSESDKKDLLFGVKQKVDMVFASFIQNRAAVREVRAALGKNGKYIKIISKVESQDALNNIHEIIDESDGVMVARGDLGIEIPPQQVFLAQKAIIAKCNMAGKPIAVATQMLDSMTRKPRATRAEISDVANAVVDGADCVMLSGETARGSYVLDAVSTMSNICLKAEISLWYRNILNDLLVTMEPKDKTYVNILAITSATMANQLKVCAIIVITNDGKMARAVSRYRPICPILTVFKNRVAARQSLFYRGIFPLISPDIDNDCIDIDKNYNFAVCIGKQLRVLKNGGSILLIHELEQGNEMTNTIFYKKT